MENEAVIRNKTLHRRELTLDVLQLGLLSSWCQEVTIPLHSVKSVQLLRTARVCYLSDTSFTKKCTVAHLERRTLEVFSHCTRLSRN